MKTYTLTIELQVAQDSLVAGFNPTGGKFETEVNKALAGIIPDGCKAELTHVKQPTFTIGELEDMGRI
jgi:hypothetical protein